MSKKALVRALTELNFSTLALKIKTLPKGTVPKTGTPSVTLGLLSEILDEDFSAAVASLVSQEKLNAIHKNRLECALSLSGVTVEDDFKLGYHSVRKDAPASEIYEQNSKNPRPEVIGALLSVDKAAKQNRTTLAVALKEAGMLELADALPAHIYISHTTPSDILHSSFVWGETKEGHTAWSKAFDTLSNIEQKNEAILKDLKKIDPSLSIAMLNYCMPDTYSKLALYKSKVSVKNVDVLTKLETGQKLKKRVVRDMNFLDQTEAADYADKMEFDLSLTENALTSRVLDSFVWKNHKAGYDFWHEVQKKVLQAEKITRTNKENLIKVTKELGYPDKAEALSSVWFTLTDHNLSAERTLMTGFGWRSSPQGTDYWNNLHKALMQVEKQKQEKDMNTPKAKLVAALRKVNLPNHANLIEGMDKDFSGSTPDFTLKSSFIWRDTEQGQLFWSEAESKLRGLGKLPTWHGDCITRRAELVSALVQIGRDDVAKIVAGLTHERFDQGEKPSVVWTCVPYSAVKNETWTKVKLQLAAKETDKDTNKNKLVNTLLLINEGVAAEHIAKMDGSIFEHDTPADMLEHDFRWVSTDQGHLYWSNILKRLCGLDKSAEWHDACKARQLLLVEACFNAGRRDAASLVKAFPYERFDEGETPVEVSHCIPGIATAQGPKFWEGLREELVKISGCTAELSAKQRLIEAVGEVTGRKFDTLAELPLSAFSAFSGLTVQTAENLVRAFDWYESEEGDAFWQAVHGKLVERQRRAITVTVFVGGGTTGRRMQNKTSQEAQKALVEACIQAGEPGAAERICRMNIIFCLGNTPAVTLKNSFNWEKTEPGYDFWRRVSEALQTPKEMKTETPHLINMHDTYKTRDGRDVRVLCVDALDDTYKVITLVKNEAGTGEYMEEYTATGAFYADEQGDDDLVLHSTKDPRDSLKIDDPVYVCSSGEWKLRYYAGKTPDGAHAAWDFGKKSFSAGATQCLWSRWKVNGVELSA